ncbi:unnamed protein product [Moneuplotes crassus]|uniref:Uncharacterized protein n=1 Tax=Euplotes crassus TaxID=5936 RepID=A0AAD1X6S4_EUPCR|nr:unnamed protein product [Moneuplotes crassus]
MNLQVRGISQGPKIAQRETYELSNFNKVMNEADINIENVRSFIEKYKYKNYEVPSDDITGTLIKQVVNFYSPFLNHSVEFTDLKNHLVLFYEEQHKKIHDREYHIPNYHVLNEIMTSLRQLIIEMLKEQSGRQQMLYLSRIFRWFYRKKIAYSVKPIKYDSKRRSKLKSKNQQSLEKEADKEPEKEENNKKEFLRDTKSTESILKSCEKTKLAKISNKNLNSRQYKIDSLSNSMNLTSSKFDRNNSYFQVRGNLKLPDPLRSSYNGVGTLSKSSSVSKDLNLSPQQYDKSYKNLLNILQRSERKRLVDVKVEKQMRKHIHHWGNAKAHRESNKVHKYDLNSLRISNVRKPRKGPHKLQNFSEGYAVFRDTLGSNLQFKKRIYKDQFGESSSDKDAEEVSSESSEASEESPQNIPHKISSLLPEKDKLRKFRKNNKIKIKKIMPNLIDLSKKDNEDRIGTSSTNKNLTNKALQKFMKMKPEKRPKLVTTKSIAKNTDKIDNVFTECETQKEVNHQITLSAFSRPEDILKISPKMKSKRSRLEILRSKRREDQFKNSYTFADSIRDQNWMEIQDLSKSLIKDGVTCSIKTIQKAFHLPEMARPLNDHQINTSLLLASNSVDQ